MTMKQNLKLEKNLAFKNQIKWEFEFFDDKTIESSSTRENLSNPFMWSKCELDVPLGVVVACNDTFMTMKYVFQSHMGL